MDGALRLVEGEAGAAFQYGRFEIFLRGFWSNVCSVDGFSRPMRRSPARPRASAVAPSSPLFQPYISTPASVRRQHHAWPVPAQHALPLVSR